MKYKTTNLEQDLSKEFFNIKGFSYHNLRYIKQWYVFWQQAVAKLVQITWGHKYIEMYLFDEELMTKNVGVNHYER